MSVALLSKTKADSMARVKRNVGGRPAMSIDERLSARVPLYVTPDLREQIETRAKIQDQSMNAFVGGIIEDFLAGKIKIADAALAGTNSVRLRYLAEPPCGDWREALEYAGHFVLSRDVADEMEVRDDDFAVRGTGQSLEGAGIPDGSILCMRPLVKFAQPRRGEIALMQAQVGEDEYLGTLKIWNKGGDVPELVDGEGKVFPLPKNLISVQAIAVARGIIGRL